ncbi:hypothetical protein AGRA3207_003966 [Actinomadura graeca]|uniref:Uncharacterized protein n=1 Tax=Actinomadura graeca TaxID=2750812 RepID=A0ABX8QVX0_9ACTN|nr:hypothetical protein [Actinomadura graeca]QXJ22890.1 hypothetical protein AGRA3207_003966 [Actinomadura graeca]
MTLAIAVTALLYLMFSTDGDKPIYRETLFGSLFFKAKPTGNGATGVTMGVANPTALIVIFVVATAVLTMTHITYRGLKHRREQLIKQQTGA